MPSHGSVTNLAIRLKKCFLLSHPQCLLLSELILGRPFSPFWPAYNTCEYSVFLLGPDLFFSFAFATKVIYFK